MHLFGTNLEDKTHGWTRSSRRYCQNDACNSLMVEWCERGERGATKGKEVDLDAILRLNPEIVSSPAELLEQPQHSAREPRKLAMQLSASSVTISSNIGRYHSTQSGGADHRTNRIAIGVSFSGGSAELHSENNHKFWTINGLAYKYTAKPLVQSIFEGGMATCFAYGQTGASKRHTMCGKFNSKNAIYAMAMFGFLNAVTYRSLNLVVSASFFEINCVYSKMANSRYSLSA